MEASETNPASRRTGLWARLSDPDKPPRRWWYPPSSRRDDVLRMSEAARQSYQQVVEQAHEKFSETIRLAMLSLLGFALFCLLITFSTPESALLVADPTIKMPFADVQVSFQSFLILAPFLLIVITLYLHIFYGYWLDLETDLQHLTLSRESSEPAIERLPTLFSLDHPVPRLLTAFIFYWLAPLVLIVITWKAAARVEWGVPLVRLTGLVTATLIFLQIRRRPAPQRQWNPLLWVVMGLIVGCMAVPPGLPRRLSIERADLKGKWLAELNLRDADAYLANLEGANLFHANLQGTWFMSANLRGADLQGADLQWVNFVDANLQGADLQNANLQGADLRRAELKGANLQGTDLQKVEGLTKEQVQSARTDENTKLPSYLKTSGPAERDNPAPPREGTAKSK
jgi:hypothetical protein